MLKRLAAAILIVTAMGGSARGASPLSPFEREVLPPYFRALHDVITARMRSIRPRPEDEGTAVVRFTVQRSGRVTAAALYRSSGSDEIDKAVLRALPAVGTQVRPFPQGVTRHELTFNVPVRFVP